MGETRLFIDWINIDKGGIHGTFDSERISDEGWRIIERNKKTWGLHADLSGHGMKSRRVPHGVRITIEKARKSGPWLQQDRPWEKKIYFITVIHEDGKYRGWYGVEFPRHREAGNDTEQVLDKDQKADFNRTGLCYAESEDGMHWIKPELGLIEFEGMKNNNIVSTSDLVSSAVFRDDSAPPEERYKAFAWDRLSDVPYRADYGLFGAFSPDGYHWTRTSEPLLPYFHDTQNIACWDAERQKYVGYFRNHLGGRAISYAETDDFRNWPETEVIAHAGPLDDPDVDYYTNCYVRYPGLPSVKLLFPAMYHHSSDQLDVRLAVTHNGKAIKWVSHDPIIESASQVRGTGAACTPARKWCACPTARWPCPTWGSMPRTMRAPLCISMKTAMICAVVTAGRSGTKDGSRASRRATGVSSGRSRQVAAVSPSRSTPARPGPAALRWSYGIARPGAIPSPGLRSRSASRFAVTQSGRRCAGKARPIYRNSRAGRSNCESV